MKKFIEAKTGKSIFIILIFLILFNFIVPNYSYASGEWIGELMNPVGDLVCSIGDGLMNIMQRIMMPGSPVAVTKRSMWEKIAAEDGDVSGFDAIGEYAGQYGLGEIGHVATVSAIAGAAILLIPGVNLVGAIAAGIFVGVARISNNKGSHGESLGRLERSV